jgi:hypothetical protein
MMAQGYVWVISEYAHRARLTNPHFWRENAAAVEKGGKLVQEQRKKGNNTREE